MSAPAPMRRLRALRGRRGTQLLLAFFFVILVGITAVFGLHALAISTAAHSRVSETAQAAAYAAASSARPGQAAGTVEIPQAEAQKLAQAVINQNLNGSFDIRPSDVTVEVKTFNLSYGIDQNRNLTGANCEATSGVAAGAQVAWRDGFGECHFASGVSVTVTAKIRPCLWVRTDKSADSLRSEKACPEVTLVGVGFADYTYQSSNR